MNHSDKFEFKSQLKLSLTTLYLSLEQTLNYCKKKIKTIQNISTFTTKKKVFNSISSKDKIVVYGHTLFLS